MHLARLRFPVDATRGRRFPEPPHPYRNDFQRDRDRIIHSRAFRRLEDKTQVFPPGISDHFRTRLTHTLEVSQVARTVAVSLGLDEDFTEALSLAHDLGHPPFAHAGEAELNRQMARFGEAFDHNIHALRIIEYFEQRYACWPGLNLTFEVREGIVKHSRELSPGETPELDEYLPGLKPPIEAQLIDLADEIAYNTADLDDAGSAGLLSLPELYEHCPELGELAGEIETMFPAAEPRLRLQELIRRLLNHLVGALIEGTRDAAASCQSVDEVRSAPHRLARLTPPAASLNTRVKRFLHQRIYHSAALAEERRRGSRQIGELFEHLLTHPEHLPPGYLDARPLHRSVCDYIAGMTEGYFRRTYTNLL